MEIVIVERAYDEPFTDEQAAETVRRAASCFELRDVTRLTSYIARDRKRAVCVYQAPDAATVRDAHDQAGIAYTKIWTSLPPLDTAP